MTSLPYLIPCLFLWYCMGAIKSQVIQSSALIETSTWTKAVMSKACKSFGINVDDLEHEVLDDILCMKEKRQLHLQKQESLGSA